MLVGVSGSGRQSLTRLCCSLYEDVMRYEIELSKGYNLEHFRDDEQRVLRLCGTNE